MRVVLLDDHGSTVTGWALIIQDEYKGQVETAKATSLPIALDLLKEPADLIISDLNLGPGPASESHIEALVPQLRGAAPRTPLVVHTASNDPTLAELALRAGADEYIPKGTDIEEFVQVIKKYLGEVPTPDLPLIEPLTEREWEVLPLLTLQNKQIADELDIAFNTVKTHVKAVMRKLDVRTRAAAVAKARVLMEQREQSNVK